MDVRLEPFLPKLWVQAITIMLGWAGASLSATFPLWYVLGICNAHQIHTMIGPKHASHLWIASKFNTHWRGRRQVPWWWQGGIGRGRSVVSPS